MIAAAEPQRVRKKPAPRRASTRQRAERLASTELGYLYHPCFDDRKAKREILDPPPAAFSKRPQAAPPRGADFYLAHLFEVPLLTKEEETYLFRKMNYLKFRADRLRRRLRPAKATEAQVQEVERLQREALDLRNRVAEANLRLIFSLAKRYATVGSPAFDEFISEGHLTLLRAIEKFDFSRGVKFSTYATWSILNGFNAMLKKEAGVQRHQVSDQSEGVAESLADHRVSLEQEKSLERVRQMVGDLLQNLNVRERKIISARFGFDAERPPTLRELGEEMGVSKERVRQLQERALQKLQSIASEEKLELTGA